MKTPLRYQITEFDCGSISLLNCLSFLFEREEIPAELVRIISTYTLECYDENGELGSGVTTRSMMKFIAKWVELFAEEKGIPLKCKYLTAQAVSPYAIAKCLKEGGCVNLRTFNGTEHYVTLTAVDDEYVYLFDPYYKTAGEYKNNAHIEYIDGHPFTFNRRVKIEYFVADEQLEFALGPIEKREAMLFFRDDSTLMNQLG